MAGPTTVITSLLLVFCTYSIIPTDSVTIPFTCCLNFVSKKIPENRVVSYQLANGSVCPKAGVIFITRNGQKLCSDPKQPWVQRHMRNLEAKRDHASKRARPPSVKFPVQRRHSNSTSLIQRHHGNSTSLIQRHHGNSTSLIQIRHGNSTSL